MPGPAQTDPVFACQSEDARDKSTKSEQAVAGKSKYPASNPSDFTDGDPWQYRTNDVAKPPDPEEAVVGENKLVAGIDQELEDVASEAREMVKRPVVTQVQRPVGSYKITDEGDHWQYRKDDVAKLPEPEEALFEENKLVAGRDQEIEDAASEVREMVKEPVTTEDLSPVGSYVIPMDPNLVCPKCQKQFRHGEIQKLRLHYHRCKK